MADYRDVDLRFNMHPITGDVSQLTDSKAVMQDIRELVMTSASEYQFDPAIGAGMYRNLFGLSDSLTMMQFETLITQQINQHCPHAELISVVIDHNSGDLNSIFIDIKFMVVNIDKVVDLKIPLQTT